MKLLNKKLRYIMSTYALQMSDQFFIYMPKINFIIHFFLEILHF